MRVVIAGWLRFEGTDCAAVIRAGAAHIAASLQEDGCIAYRWATDPLDADLVHVFEEWASEQALGRHMRDPSYIAMRDHLGTHTLTGFDINLYAAGEVMPVYGEDGLPRDVIFGVRVTE